MKMVQMMLWRGATPVYAAVDEQRQLMEERRQLMIDFASDAGFTASIPTHRRKACP